MFCGLTNYTNAQPLEANRFLRLLLGLLSLLLLSRLRTRMVPLIALTDFFPRGVPCGCACSLASFGNLLLAGVAGRGVIPP